MLERMAGVLARLHTFELIEGGKRPLLPPMRPHGGGGGDSSGSRVADDGASDGLMGDGGSPSAARGKENEDGNDVEAGGGDGDGYEDEDGSSSRDSGGDEDGYDGADDHNGPAAAGPSSPLHAAGNGATNRSTSGSTSSASSEEEDGGAGAVLSEVARWLRFRTVDLVSFVGSALQAGDVQAAAVAWRRHGRTDRGAGRAAAATAAAAAVPGRSSAAAAGGGAGGAVRKGGVEEGRRLEAALPGQLATVPAAAPPALLGAWLRDEVLPWLDVAGVIAVS